MKMRLAMLALFSLAINGGEAQTTHEDFGDIKFVIKYRFEWEEIVRNHSSPKFEQSIIHALSVADSDSYHSQLAKDEARLAVISPKEFINPFWWPLVQQVYVLRKEAAAERPPSEFDRILVIEWGS